MRCRFWESTLERPSCNARGNGTHAGEDTEEDTEALVGAIEVVGAVEEGIAEDAPLVLDALKVTPYE